MVFKKPKTPIPQQQVQSTVISTIKTTVFYTAVFLVFGILVGGIIDLVR